MTKITKNCPDNLGFFELMTDDDKNVGADKESGKVDQDLYSVWELTLLHMIRLMKKMTLLIMVLDCSLMYQTISSGWQ